MLQTSLLTQSSELGELTERVNACCGTTSSNVLQKGDNVSKPYVHPLAPCKYSDDLMVELYVPNKAKEAKFFIYSLSGTLLHTFDVKVRGKGELLIPKETIRNGVYLYALLVDGQMTEMKKMFIVP